MEITVENQQKKIRLSPAKISRIAKTILRHEGVLQATLSIVFVTSQKIRALNKKYLKRAYATDVLAFDLRDTIDTIGDRPLRRSLRGLSPIVIGDVIISTDAVKKNAHIYKTTQNKELILYVIHGILHLLGYDDHSVRDIDKMRKKEEQLLEYLKIK